MLLDSKRLGQHFLVSRPVLAKIIAAARIGPTDTVLEIGPGTGTLTRELAKHAHRVIAVEKDVRLADLLRETLAAEGIKNVEIIRGDILTWLPLHCSLLPARYKVVANIPYYLTSRLIRKLLEAERPPRDILLMVQKEVAERIVAQPPHMNLLALSVQAYGTPELVTRVPKEAFRPQPKVESALVKISDISARFFLKNRIKAENFFAITRAAFGQKRKILANSLTAFFGGKAQAEAAIITSGLAPWVRAEELGLDDWLALLREKERSRRVHPS